MSEQRGAVFVDLDRTLIRSASGPVFHDAMEAEGVIDEGRHLPGDRLLYRLYDVFGESVPFIALARAAATVMRGRSADGTRRAGKRAVEALVDLVQPFALETLATHRQAGRPLVLADDFALRPGDSPRPRPRFRRGDRHPLRGVRRAVHGQARRRLRLGCGQARRQPASGPPITAASCAPRMPTPTASSTCRSFTRWAIPTRSTPI